MGTMKIQRTDKIQVIIEVLTDDIEKLCDAIESLHPGEHTHYLKDFREHCKQARINDHICGLVVTMAPKDYDYGYVIEVDPEYGTFNGKNVRLVAMPYGSIDYQCGRYASGMYLACSQSRAEEIGVKRHT